MQILKNIQDCYFSQIVSGKKTVEGRLCKGDFIDLKIGDSITFHNNNNEKINVIVKQLEYYCNFVDFLEDHLKNTLPDIESIMDGLKIYKSLYREEDEKYHGVIAIIFEII
jgi:ASC-1-like (ASCH) protein